MMITNDRQYRISKAQWSRIRGAIDSFDFAKTAARVGSDVLAKAELEALKSEADALSEQIREYEGLRSGAFAVLKATSLQDLPLLLVRARIAQGLSQRALAQKLGIKEQQIQRYEAEQYASASLRRLIQVAEALSLDVKEIAEMRQSAPDHAHQASQKIEWGLFPVKEMYRRGWFDDIDFKGSMSAAISHGAELAREYLQKAMPHRQPMFLKHRARIGSEVNQYALLAWQCRVLLLARNKPAAGSYSRDSITDKWLKSLARESTDGPRSASRMLGESGIQLIIEPQMPQTYLDGATFLLPDERPVIGMTLRYDRLDNFWFVLFHELVHVMRHMRKGKLEQIFDDLDAEPDLLEREADLLAGNALIPESDWEVALARYLRTEDSVKSFAEEHHIHPAIVAGRIRKEADNYVILKDLIGIGEVRKQFPEVRFAQ